MEKADYYSGGFKIGNIPVWEIIPKLTSNAKLWERVFKFPSKSISCEELDSHDLKLFDLIVTVDVDDWITVCSIMGMTVYGAVSLSWCKNSELSQVWEGWEASGFPFKPLPEFERPARFINPALMPQTNKLTGMLEAFNDKYSDSQTTYSLAICAAIAALKEPLDFDMSAEQMAKATPQIASFLKSRMLQKSARTAEESALIEVWTKTVKGTEFDVWETT